VNAKTTGYETDLDTFLGQNGGWDDPETISKGKCSNSLASGWSPIACHEITLVLKPGEEKTLVFNLGYVENEEDKKFDSLNVINKDKAHELIRKFDTVDAFDSALEDLKRYWSDLLGKFSIHSDEEKFDRMINIWNQYQCMITFNFSRSASYFESGTGRGMGFRDSCQDLLGFVHLIPERARQRNTRYRCHSSKRRLDVSPISAAHQTRQRRCRRRL